LPIDGENVLMKTLEKSQHFQQENVIPKIEKGQSGKDQKKLQ